MAVWYSWVKMVWDDFLSLIYPNLCFCCGEVLVKQENIICTSCVVGLPRTNFHMEEGNPVEQLFWGRVPIEKATSYFIFQKGSRYRKLLHQLKYKGFRSVGVEMGQRFGAELISSGYFDDIDVLVPVPLHPKKQRKRGYNQSLAIAEGLAFSLGKQIDSTNLYRTSHTESQTRKGRFERWQNVNALFDVRNLETFEHRHILLIDDVVTTGSTLEACAYAVRKSKGAKVSVATLAFASI
jgi:ComF family protein